MRFRQLSADDDDDARISVTVIRAIWTWTWTAFCTIFVILIYGVVCCITRYSTYVQSERTNMGASCGQVLSR